MKSRIILLSSLVILTIASFGQNASNHSVSSNTKHENVLIEINLEENSKLEEDFLNVDKRTKSLFIEIRGSLKKGQVRVQIYDPKGKKWKQDLAVDSRYADEVFKYPGPRSIPVPDSIRYSTKPTLVYIGRFGITINRPKSGHWKVKVVPENAIGKVQVCYSYGR